jgi:hypothetical protein
MSTSDPPIEKIERAVRSLTVQLTDDSVAPGAEAMRTVVTLFNLAWTAGTPLGLVVGTPGTPAQKDMVTGGGLPQGVETLKVMLVWAATVAVVCSVAENPEPELLPT